MNYILIATGLLFLEKRKSKSLTSLSVAESLYIGESTVRNFENGVKNITPEKFVGYSKIFDNFLFDKLCRLTIGLHLLDKETSLETLIGKIEEIKKNGDDELAQVFRCVEKIYIEQKTYNKQKQKEIIKLKSLIDLKSSIEKFLLVKKSLSDEAINAEFLRTITKEISEEISSYDLDEVLNFLKLRKKKPLLIKNDTIEEWEKEIKYFIESIYGITNNIESIVEIENIREFDYSYLFNKDGFKSYKIIFYNVEKSTGSEQKFKDNLIEIYKDRFDKETIEIGLSKIHFRFINLNNNNSYYIKSILSSKLNNQVPSLFDNFWAYKLKEGRMIDFLSNKQQDDSNNFLGVSDSLNIVIKKIESFNNIWDQIKQT